LVFHKMDVVKNALECLDRCCENFSKYFLDTFQCHSECRGCCSCDVKSSHYDDGEVPGGDGQTSEGPEKSTT